MDIDPETGIDWALLERVAAGEGTAAEQRIVDDLLAANPSLHRIVSRLAAPAATGWDTASAWRKLEPRLTPKRQERSWAWRAAAAIALIASGAWTFSLVHGQRGPLLSADTAPGETRTIAFADGSTVLLAPSSHIEYPSRFRRHRDVVLTGEGYFTVAHDGPPFRVHVNGHVIRDIGTRFNVRGYTADTTSVTVTQGAVSVEPAGSTVRPLVLKASESASINAAGVLERFPVDTASATGWRSHLLVFEDVSMDRAAAAIERMYGVRLVVEPELARRRVTARFIDRPVDVVLNSTAGVLHAAWTRSGDTIYLRVQK